MAKNDLTLLDSILDEYCANGIPSTKPDEVFEFFSTEQVLKDYVFSKEDLLQGSVDGRNDGGIDEFYIVVNGHIAENIPADYWPKSNAELEVFIFTCKHDDSFKQAPITTMIPSLIDLLDFSKPSSSFSDYNEKLLKKRDLFISTYKRLASSLVKFDLHLIYACRGNETIESNIQAKADQAEAICNDSFSGCNVSFEFWGNTKLLARYRERENNSADLAFEQCINQDGQYVILASIKKYYDFLLDSKGNLNKHLFESNVRDYLGLNPVNIDIQKSLVNNAGPDFWWLNNGITIIGTDAHIIGKTITISNVQIVNGLQTSESIFNYFSGRITGSPIEADARAVLIKIIISSDKETNDEIIYATNNQTNVNVTALRATDRIQMDIEDILKANHIYYERKTNFYQNQGIPEHLIISPLSLAAGYICLIYKNPYVATSLKQKFMRDNRKYEKVFSSSVDLNVWAPIASLIMRTDQYLDELKANIPGSPFRLHKYYRQIVLFVTVSRIFGTFAFNEKSLIGFDLNRFTKAEVEKSLYDLSEVDPDCFSRTKKPNASFYTRVFIYVAGKHNIDSIKAIQAKNKRLWAGTALIKELKLSDELLERVENNLPAQPWPVNIHERVAQELKLPNNTVSDAISYLIYSNKLHYQVYGFVFDENGKVIAEGEHHGRSVEDAKIKQKEQEAFFARKFGF